VAAQVAVDQDGTAVQKHSMQAEMEQSGKDIQAVMVYTITAHQQAHITVVVAVEVLVPMDITDILDTTKPAEAKASLLISADL
jgi:hypothetical protein